MEIIMTNHALQRAKQRMGWSTAEAKKRAKIDIEEYIAKNPGGLLFEDKFYVGCGFMEWVVLNENNEFFTVVTLLN
jgi:hypothetical protein